MIKVVTKSGSVYEFDEEAKTYKRYPAYGAGDIEQNEGEYFAWSGADIGYEMTIKTSVPYRPYEYYNIYTTPVVSIDV